MLSIFAAALSAGAASAAERRYTVTDFDRIQVEGPFQVVISTGRPASAAASGSNQAIDRVSIDVQGRTLRVRPNKSAWGGFPGEGVGPLRIELSTHNLRAASVTGSGSVTIDKAKAMRFEAALSGSGRLAVRDIEADMLALGLLGSGRMEFGGRAKQLRATVQGTGDLMAEQLMVEDAQINADTAGTIAVTARRAANVTATGSGDTTILGKPACTTNAMGSGRVLCGSR